MVSKVVALIIAAMFFIFVLVAVGMMIFGNGEAEDMPTITNKVCAEFDVTDDCTLAPANETPVEATETGEDVQSSAERGELNGNSAQNKSGGGVVRDDQTEPAVDDSGK